MRVNRLTKEVDRTKRGGQRIIGSEWSVALNIQARFATVDK